MHLRHLLPLALGFNLSCNAFNKGACKDLSLEICEQCDIPDEYEETYCACLKDGEVEDDDAFGGSDEAELWCAEVQNSVKGTYQTDETVAECRSDLDLLKEFGDDYCEEIGFASGGDGGDGGDGYYGYDSGFRR